MHLCCQKKPKSNRAHSDSKLRACQSGGLKWTGEKQSRMSFLLIFKAFLLRDDNDLISRMPFLKNLENLTEILKSMVYLRAILSYTQGKFFRSQRFTKFC